MQCTIKLIHTDMRRFVVFTIMLMVALTASANYKGPDVRHMGTKKTGREGPFFCVPRAGIRKPVNMIF